MQGEKIAVLIQNLFCIGTGYGYEYNYKYGIRKFCKTQNTNMEEYIVIKHKIIN